MTYIPSRMKGLAIGLAMLAVLLLGLVSGVLQLTKGQISPLLALWVALPIFCLPLALVVLYRLFGLITARYVLDRNGFYLRWGFVVEEIPINALLAVHDGDAVAGPLRPASGFWWPGCVVGRRVHATLGNLAFFATTGVEGLLVLQLPEGSIAISPVDREGFRQAVRNSSRLGALEIIERRSQAPDFFSVRLWSNRWARSMILAGLILPLALLAFLGFQANRLPMEVPFGFTPSGHPGPWAPPTRLLLLALMVGFWWLVDLILGVWLYRREQHQPIAYIVWGASPLLGILVWIAVLQLLAAA